MLTRQIEPIWTRSHTIWRASGVTPCLFAKICGLLCVCLLSFSGTIQPLAAQQAPPKPAALLTGTRFADTLLNPLSLSWTERPLRTGMNELGELKRVSILLDRRLDPSSPVSLEAQRIAVMQIIKQAAKPLNADISAVGNVLYVGPRLTAQRLRTMVDLRHDEILTQINSGKGKPAPAAITARTNRRSVTWDDLTTPTEIVKLIAEKYELTVDGIEAVPHDLWAKGTLPSVTSSEALQLILGQFDLSFEWSETGKGVRVVPLPEAPRVERMYEVGTKADQLAKSLPQDVPEAAITVNGTKLIVSGRSEEHDQIDAILHPNRQVARKPNAAPPQVLFTFEVKNVRLIDFMQNFEKQSDFRFDYDADELEQAGIKLTREITLKMQRAKPADLFRAMFADIGIDFEIDGTTVKLRPL